MWGGGGGGVQKIMLSGGGGGSVTEREIPFGRGSSQVVYNLRYKDFFKPFYYFSHFRATQRNDQPIL